MAEPPTAPIAKILKSCRKMARELGVSLRGASWRSDKNLFQAGIGNHQLAFEIHPGSEDSLVIVRGTPTPSAWRESYNRPHLRVYLTIQVTGGNGATATMTASIITRGLSPKREDPRTYMQSQCPANLHDTFVEFLKKNVRKFKRKLGPARVKYLEQDEAARRARLVYDSLPWEDLERAGVERADVGVSGDFVSLRLPGLEFCGKTSAEGQDKLRKALDWFASRPKFLSVREEDCDG